MRTILWSFFSKPEHPKGILGICWMLTKNFYKFNKQELGRTKRELLQPIAGKIKSQQYIMC